MTTETQTRPATRTFVAVRGGPSLRGVLVAFFATQFAAVIAAVALLLATT